MTDLELEPLVTPNPATTDWVPIWNMTSGIPPVVNGQWIKGVGGAMVWSAIRVADLPLKPVLVGYVTAGGGFGWAFAGAGMTFSVAHAGAGNTTITATAGFSSSYAPIFVSAAGQSAIVGAVQVSPTTWNVYGTTPGAWSDWAYYVTIYDATGMS